MGWIPPRGPSDPNEPFFGLDRNGMGVFGRRVRRAPMRRRLFAFARACFAALREAWSETKWEREP